MIKSHKKIQVVSAQAVEFAKEIYKAETIPLHRPVFDGNEKRYLAECIDSNFVSSAGALIQKFEDMFCDYTGAQHSIAVTNGTSALHLALIAAGVETGTEVITQSLTFVATCNAIRYVGADPVFCDVSADTFGLSSSSLEAFLASHVEVIDGRAVNRLTRRIISACLPMHTFGNPSEIMEIKSLCDRYFIPLVEDCAEALGSYVGNVHVGNFGKLSTFSFNGNKVITTGGGGMVTTNCNESAKKIRHLSTTAKVTSNDYNFYHDEVGYNYRLPNLNAALGCAQMERLDAILADKAEIHENWVSFFDEYDLRMLKPKFNNISNHWLNAVIFDCKADRDHFLNYTNENGVMCRPVWHLMHTLPEFKKCINFCSKNAEWLQQRVVNIPSSARMK